MVMRVLGQCRRMRRIGPEKVKVVAVWIAAGNRQHACSQHILHRVGDVRRVARIVDQSGKRFGYRPAALGKRKQDYAAVRGQTAAIECGCDFLARHSWQGKGKRAIVSHGGCGRAV